VAVWSRAGAYVNDSSPHGSRSELAPTTLASKKPSNSLTAPPSSLGTLFQVAQQIGSVRRRPPSYPVVGGGAFVAGPRSEIAATTPMSVEVTLLLLGGSPPPTGYY